MLKEEEPWSARFARVEAKASRLEKTNIQYQVTLRDYEFPGCGNQIDCWGKQNVNVKTHAECPEEDDDQCLLWFDDYIIKLEAMNNAMQVEIKRLSPKKEQRDSKRFQPLEMTLITYSDITLNV